MRVCITQGLGSFLMALVLVVQTHTAFGDKTEAVSSYICVNTVSHSTSHCIGAISGAYGWSRHLDSKHTIFTSICSTPMVVSLRFHRID